MNKEIAAQWVEELKSGKYQKGEGKLHRVNGGYCCLGVLCEMAIKAGVLSTTEVQKQAGLSGEYTAYDGEVNYIPQRVLEWAKIEYRRGTFKTPFTVAIGSRNIPHINLAAINDNVDSFDPVIAAIEARVDEL